MTQTPASHLTLRDILRIAACLATTCLLAGAVLGAAYYFTEPVRQAETARSEAHLVRKLLELPEGSRVTEVRRYIRKVPPQRFAYLLPNELRIMDTAGKLEKTVPIPAELSGKPPEDLDRWVGEQDAGTYAGRFFVGRAGANDSKSGDKSDGKVAGYVTESSHYGFKSPIRFFVALTSDFQIRGVEVVGHEEDPGLGAEIVKPFFKNQFAGRDAKGLQALAVTKDPLPADRRTAAIARETMPFVEWIKQFGAPTVPIYAVTGATISSQGLADGVKEAVVHLQYRLGIASPPQ